MSRSIRCNDAIDSLNTRFKEHGLGYQYSEGRIYRIDSELIHSEVVKPVLVLLHGSNFRGAQSEYLSAHQHYRNGKYKEALVDGLKAMESTMKVICDKRKWPYDSNATCKKLFDVCFEHGLIPSYWTQHFSAIRSTLESGVPSARNRLGGHGQGKDVVQVPGFLVSFVLHQTASAIVFLVEADKSLP